MKQFYATLLALLSIQLAFAATNKANINGLWRSNSTWSLGRQPSSGDTIIIPSGRAVTVDNNWNIDPSKLVIHVYGVLNITGGGSKLIIGNGSKIYIYSGARVQGAGSPSEIIKIGGNTVFKGNEPAISGPAMATSSSDGFDSFAEAALPVKFIGFSLSRKKDDVLVQWSTSEEVNADRYELERSFDGVNWSAIAYILAAGNSSTVNQYSFADKNISGRVVYYRIKQVDTDARFVYTPIKSMKFDATAETGVKIAAAGNKVVLHFPAEVKGGLQVRLLNMNGQVLEQQSFNTVVGQLVLTPRLTGKGAYMVEVSNGNDLRTARQILL